MKIIRSSKELKESIENRKIRCTCPECGAFSPIEYRHKSFKKGWLFYKEIITTRHTCLDCGCVWED